MTARERRLQSPPTVAEVLSSIKVETVTFKPTTEGKCLICEETIPNNTKQKFCSRNCQYVYLNILVRYAEQNFTVIVTLNIVAHLVQTGAGKNDI